MRSRMTVQHWSVNLIVHFIASPITRTLKMTEQGSTLAEHLNLTYMYMYSTLLVKYYI